MAAVVAGAGALTACGSAASQPPIPSFNPATVSGAHRSYSFPDRTVALPRYPDPCTLLPKSSAAALVGGPVTVKRSNRYCFYAPDVSTYPLLQIGLRYIGPDPRDDYLAQRRSLRRAGPAALPHLGRAAFITSKGKGKTILVDGLTRQVHFEIMANSLSTSPPDVRRKREIAIRTAHIVAAQFH